MSPVFRHGRLRLYLLRLLDEEPRHGYEVIRMLRDQFMGVYAPSPGTIYPRLARLEEEGLVTHDEIEGRKVYRITEAGRQELHEREDELAELEQELSDSVRDIVREVKEDVRETVRSLREELTWAARAARRPDEQDGQDGPGRPGTESSGTGPSGAGSADTMPPGDPFRSPGTVAEEAAQRAGWSREEAREQVRRVREGAKENARRVRDDAKEWARQEREQARSAGRDRDWGNWAAWADWPGRRGWPGRPDAGLLRELEQTVKGFARDLGRLAWQSGAAAGEDALAELRIILDETLERVRSEIFETGGAHGHDDPRPAPDPELRAGGSAPGDAAGASAPGAQSPPGGAKPEPGSGPGALSPTSPAGGPSVSTPKCATHGSS
jgi:DNA-binding PadR family transcriptional regulator